MNYQYQVRLKSYLEYLLDDRFLLTGNVSEDKARCWNKIVKIARVINQERFDEFVKQKKEEFASDKMFIHRMKQSLREE